MTPDVVYQKRQEYFAKRERLIALTLPTNEFIELVNSPMIRCYAQFSPGGWAEGKLSLFGVKITDGASQRASYITVAL